MKSPTPFGHNKDLRADRIRALGYDLLPHGGEYALFQHNSPGVVLTRPSLDELVAAAEYHIGPWLYTLRLDSGRWIRGRCPREECCAA